MAFQDFNAAGFLRCLSAFYSDLYFALRSRLGYLSVKLKLNICYDREEQNMNLSNTLWSMDLVITAPRQYGKNGLRCPTLDPEPHRGQLA